VSIPERARLQAARSRTRSAGSWPEWKEAHQWIRRCPAWPVPRRPRSASADSDRENSEGACSIPWRAQRRDCRGRRVSRARDSGARDRYEFDREFCEALRRLLRLLATRSISTAATRTRGSSESRAASTRWKSRSVSRRWPRQESRFLWDQAERLVGPVDGKFEKALGLLLGRQVADCLHVGVISTGIGGRH